MGAHPLSSSQMIVVHRGSEIRIKPRTFAVRLVWRGLDELELFAFYQARNGRTGAVGPGSYVHFDTGSFHSFPFIHYPYDLPAVIVERTNPNSEGEDILHIARLDDMARVIFTAACYEEASRNLPTNFNRLRVRLEFQWDRHQPRIVVPFEAEGANHVALPAIIDNTNPSGPRLVNESRLLSLDEWQRSMPGVDRTLAGG